jgi:hypothetical protein
MSEEYVKISLGKSALVPSRHKTERGSAGSTSKVTTGY